MNEIARIKNEVRLKQWAEMVRCRNESGLSVSQWCRQNGVNQKTYYYRLNRVRKAIDGLAAIVQQNFGLDVFSGSLFLFCGKRCDRIKALLWEEDGFVLLYKRLENGKYKWPRDSNEAKLITRQEFRWLLEGLSIEQKTAIKPAKTGSVC